MANDSPEQRSASQQQNYHLSLAGEFYVAAELQRRQPRVVQ